MIVQKPLFRNTKGLQQPYRGYTELKKQPVKELFLLTGKKYSHYLKTQ